MFFIEIVNGQNITDKDRRSFTVQKPIWLDINGDGRLDKITPRIYVTRRKIWGRRKRSFVQTEQHWITFDLQSSDGRKTPNIIRYQYGTEQSDYWAYALVNAGDLNKDGKKDLLFYAGDDTSEERVFYLNQSGAFKLYKRRVNDFSK